MSLLRLPFVPLVLLAPLALAQGANDDLARGLAGKKRLDESVERALRVAPQPSSTALDLLESGLKLSFSAVKAGDVRVLSTGGEEEARSVALDLGAARALFVELVGPAVQLPAGMRAFLLSSSEERDLFLGRHPALTLELRASVGKLEGTGIPGTADWAFWEGDPEKRRDGLVRFAFDWFLQSLGVSHARHPWLHEGLGFYLTHAMTGTRLTWFTPAVLRGGKDEEEQQALLARMKDGEDWLALAADRFAPEQSFDLEELFHLLPGELDPSDYLRLHALAAYLVEVQPAALGPVVTRVGADEDPREVLEQALGFPLTELRGRLDAWVRAREAALSKAGGRRTPAELSALWKRAGPEVKRAAIKLYKERLAALDTAQMRLVRAALASSDTPSVRRAELEFYDPATHAPGLPIPRKRLASGDPRVKRLVEAVRGKGKKSEPTHDFDWGRGVVLRLEGGDDPESLFQTALRGVPPQADLARARLLALLERVEDRKLQAAFEHAYSDREGNVFPLSLYELWTSGQTMEMPDVDNLGLVHDVLGEWQRWVSPVPDTGQPSLYQTVGDLFRQAKRARELRLGLADVALYPQAARATGEVQATTLHALWALYEEDVQRLAAALPAARDGEAFARDVNDKVRRDPKYGRGRQRAARLRSDGEALRAALGAALEEALAAAAAESAPR